MNVGVGHPFGPVNTSGARLRRVRCRRGVKSGRPRWLPVCLEVLAPLGASAPGAAVPMVGQLAALLRDLSEMTRACLLRFCRSLMLQDYLLSSTSGATLFLSLLKVDWDLVF